MRVLITGAGGFLGNHLVEDFLTSTNSEVFAMSSQTHRLMEQFGGSPMFHLASTVPENIDVLISCAFPRNADGANMAEGLDYIASLYSEAAAKNVRGVINISSQSVYSSKRMEPATEETRVELETKYAVGKYAVELLTNDMFWDRPHTNLRMASLIGVGFDQRVPNKFVKQVLSGADICIKGGTQVFGYLNVDDAAAAIVKATEQINTCNILDEVYNLGPQKSMTLLEIARAVQAAVKEYGIQNTNILLSENGDWRNSSINSEQFRNIFRWCEKIPFEATIKRIIEAEI